MDEILKLLMDYNGIIKESNNLYRGVIGDLGLSDSAFWILYTLRENAGVITQKDIVNANYLPPQTINSALKKLEAQGVVALDTARDKRKKAVRLTAKGERLAALTADRVLAAEVETMASLSPQERQAFLGLFRRYTDLLKENLTILNQEKRKSE